MSRLLAKKAADDFLLEGAQEGDLFIEPDDCPFNPHLLEAELEVSHMLLYSDNKVIHNTAGGYGKSNDGAKIHRIKAERFDRTLLVLRLKNIELAKVTRSFTRCFALSPENYHKSGLSHYPTRYSSPYMRIKSNESRETSQPMAYALLRAYRTWIKATESKAPASLSTNQGLSCSQFIFYNLQAAALTFLHGSLMTLLSAPSQKLIQQAITIIRDRIKGEEKASNLKAFLSAQTSSMETLQQELEKLLLVLPALSLFQLNAKGCDILEITEFLLQQKRLIAAMVCIVDTDTHTAKIVDMATAKELPSEFYDPELGAAAGAGSTTP